MRKGASRSKASGSKINARAGDALRFYSGSMSGLIHARIIRALRAGESKTERRGPSADGVVQIAGRQREVTGSGRED